MERNSWRHTFLATPAGEQRATVQAELTGKGDPGYGSTSRMVLEAGLALALQVVLFCNPFPVVFAAKSADSKHS